jgi:hypothetical protein
VEPTRMSDRALRDELERIQVEVKGLEAELLAEHAPRFLAKRDALNVAVKEAQDAVLELERTSSRADAGLAELQQRVETLAARLRAVEQSRLSAPPVFVLAPVAFLGLVFVAPRLQFQIIGVTGAAIFGLLFGTRLGAWALGRREMVPKPAPVTRAPRPALFSAVFAGLFAAMAILGGAVQLEKLWSEFTGPAPVSLYAIDRNHFASTMPLQFVSIVALLLASRVHRLSRDVNPEAARSGFVIATIASIVLCIIVASWIPVLQRLLQADEEMYEVHRLHLGLVSSLAPLIPAALVLAIIWRPRIERRWPLIASIACAVSAAAITLWSARQLRSGWDAFEEYDFAEGWSVIELALLGAALAQGRWLGLLACLGAVGLTGLRLFGVF